MGKYGKGRLFFFFMKLSIGNKNVLIRHGLTFFLAIPTQPLFYGITLRSPDGRSVKLSAFVEARVVKKYSQEW